MRGARSDSEEAQLVLYSAQKSTGAKRGARGQIAGPNSIANAREGYDVGHQQRGHPLVPNGCLLVCSRGPAHLSSVRVHLSKGGAQVYKAQILHRI